MQLSNLPSRVQVPFAVSGAKRTIPVASQIGVTPGAASFTDGFPPLTMLALNAGGIPPAGVDFNGILNAATLIQQWQSAGGSFPYDAAWSTANNGYPKGAVLLRADGTGYWFNTTDNNTADPDGATPTGWVPEWQYGITTVAGLTNSNVTLSSLQYGREVIVLTGTLTGNVQIFFPAILERWLVVNNTTGNFTLTAKTAAGSGINIPTGAQVQTWGDGTNLYGNTGATLLATRVFNTPGTSTYTPTPGTRYIEVEMVGGGGAGGGSSAAGAGQISVPGGGGSGAYARGVFTAGYSGATLTVGAGGAGVAAGTGGTGGATSIGALMTANGGVGSGGAAAVTPSVPYREYGTAPTTGTSGANVISAAGGPGAYGFWLSSGSFQSGGGGPSFFGSGGGATVGSGAGASAASPGAGGAGAMSLAGSGAFAGGNGGNGTIIIREYA